MQRFLVSFLLAFVAVTNLGYVLATRAFHIQEASEPAPADVLVLRAGTRAWHSFDAPARDECREGRLLADGRVRLRYGVTDFAFDPETGRFTPIPIVFAPTRSIPAGFDGRFFPVGESASLALPSGSCAIVVEPGSRTLPSLPVCPRGYADLAAATVLDDGTVYAIVWDSGAHRFHLFALDPGADAFVERGVIPLAVSSVDLVPAHVARAVAVAGDGAIFAIDRTGVRALPRPAAPRFAERVAVTDRGDVVACGGSLDTSRHAFFACTVLAIAPFVFAVGVFVALRKKMTPSIPGLLTGTVVGIVCVIGGILGSFAVLLLGGG